MDFGVPVERHRTEHRVGLTPRGARTLVELGHRVFVETQAGDASHFPDAAYLDAGAEIVFRRLHEASGFHNYYWKCRPVPQAAS